MCCDDYKIEQSTKTLPAIFEIESDSSSDHEGLLQRAIELSKETALSDASRRGSIDNDESEWYAQCLNLC